MDSPSPLQDALGQRRALVLDGALATELERRGAELSGGLWSARLLDEQPGLIAAVHRDYFEAGADVAITASYQASVDGFVRAGFTAAQARRLLLRSVELAGRARDEFWADQPSSVRRRRMRPLVATSVGPYGAVLADGSEYRGDYDVSPSDLVRFHRERLAVLVDAGVEVLAVETLPSLVEARAVVEAIASWPSLTAWVSFSARDGRQVSDGTSVAECAAWLDLQPQVVAVGVNCTAVENVTPLLHELGSATSLPLVAYPNSGEVWDAERRRWRGTPVSLAPPRSPQHVLTEEWYAAGARLIGGCCRTGPADVQAISATLRDSVLLEPPEGSG